MNTPRRTALELSYNGKNVTAAITDQLESFTYTDVASGETDTLAIVLSEEKHKWINAWFPVEEDYMEASVQVKDWNFQGDNRRLKCGKFMVDDFTFNGPPDVYNLNAISCPIDTDFASTTKSKSWSKTTTKGIASTIAKSAGISLHYDADIYKIEKLEQSNETDMTFLFRLCDSYGLAMKIYNSKLVIFSETAYEKKKAVGTIDKKDCENYTLNGTLVGKYHGVIMKYTVSKTNKTYTYKYMQSQGKRILKLNEKADSLADAEIKAKAKLRKSNKDARTINLTLKGDIKYIAGTCFNITGFGKFNGNYYIDKAVHTLSGGYTVTLQMHMVDAVSGNSKTTGTTAGKDGQYEVITQLTGYYTAEEAKSQKSVKKTGKVYPGTYYIYNTSNGMINVTKVKGVPGSWINPNKNGSG
ncbi:phage late control D family protein [Anaerocolumna sp. MB42-C2]|uniref:phage late control D family protein n=1 Tax=Anaerocolumna sp. MB42-C2 TaxID=3070997 RepID=UPI0027DF025A|nr:hypothetical protein [Anaerocolumna sp. MB42-C2]WMJ88859.1 hypothetical protein RBU59_04900 [Anaerocolumna sp. MB42-C2]